jgi:hypothetical protein
MPVNPRYTAEEWEEIYAAQKLSSEYSPNFKQDYAGKVDVPLDDVHQRICNGSPAANCQFPWQVALLIDNMYFCGGSLISRKWIVTAAHCAGSSYQIILGTNQWNPLGAGALLLSSTVTIVHPKYDPNTIENDIALIKLPIRVNFTCCIKPIRLRYIEKLLDGKTVTASGWGRTCDGTGLSPILNYANLIVMPHALCAFVYGPDITCNVLCTYPLGASICQGDSGGPLVYLEKDGKYTLVGISSFVAANGCLPWPSGFTNVIRYLCWIAKHTGIFFCFCP